MMPRGLKVEVAVEARDGRIYRLPVRFHAGDPTPPASQRASALAGRQQEDAKQPARAPCPPRQGHGRHMGRPAPGAEIKPESPRKFQPILLVLDRREVRAGRRQCRDFSVHLRSRRAQLHDIRRRARNVPLERGSRRAAFRLR